jgi:hypothetical protein
MLPNYCHKAVQDAGEYYPAAALNKYQVLLQQPHKDQQPTKTSSTDRQYLQRLIHQSLLLLLLRFFSERWLFRCCKAQHSQHSAAASRGDLQLQCVSSKVLSLAKLQAVLKSLEKDVE